MKGKCRSQGSLAEVVVWASQQRASVDVLSAIASPPRRPRVHQTSPRPRPRPRFAGGPAQAVQYITKHSNIIITSAKDMYSKHRKEAESADDSSSPCIVSTKTLDNAFAMSKAQKQTQNSQPECRPAPIPDKLLSCIVPISCHLMLVPSNSAWHPFPPRANHPSSSRLSRARAWCIPCGCLCTNLTLRRWPATTCLDR